MVLSVDLLEVGRLLDVWDARCGPHLTVDPPTEVLVGEVDPDGWGEWRMIPSPVTPANLHALEGVLGVPLPPFYRAFLCCRVVLGLDFGDYTLPSIWPGAQPLSDVLARLQSGYAYGYLEFASARGCGDPVCFDLHDLADDGDYGIVVFNHDVVPDAARSDTRALRKYAASVAPSFRVFLTNLLAGDESMFPPPVSPEETRRNTAWSRVAKLLEERGLPLQYRPPGVDAADPWAIAKALEQGAG
jgi:hypothetical protein